MARRTCLCRATEVRVDADVRSPFCVAAEGQDRCGIGRGGRGTHSEFVAAKEETSWVEGGAEHGNGGSEGEVGEGGDGAG